MNISVIVTTHNGASYIRDALHSIRGQTHVPQQIIVVDDGSTDGTADLVSREFSDVRVIRQANRGAAAARNAGLGEATGDFVAFCDDDDLWLPWKLATDVRAVETIFGGGQPLPGLIASTPVAYPERFPRLERCLGGMRMPQRFRLKPETLDNMLVRCGFMPTGALVPRPVFGHVGAFDTTLRNAQDLDLWLRIAAEYPVYRIVHPRTWVYRRRPGSLSSNTERVSESLLRVLGKWCPGGDYAGRVSQRAWERSCARHVLMIRYRNWCARLPEPDGLPALPYGGPLASAYSLVVWLSRWVPPVFTLFARAYTGLRTLRGRPYPGCPRGKP